MSATDCRHNQPDDPVENNDLWCPNKKLFAKLYRRHRDAYFDRNRYLDTVEIECRWIVLYDGAADIF